MLRMWCGAALQHKPEVADPESPGFPSEGRDLVAVTVERLERRWERNTRRQVDVVVGVAQGLEARLRFMGAVGNSSAAMGTSTTDMISSSSGIIVLGPRMQFSPSTSAPAYSRRLQASAMDQLAVELRDLLRVLEHDLRHESPGLQITPAL
jgi:hypothetical protein